MATEARSIRVDGQDMVACRVEDEGEFVCALYLTPRQAGALAEALGHWAVDYAISLMTSRKR